jgi:hypothetical protein
VPAAVPCRSPRRAGLPLGLVLVLGAGGASSAGDAVSLACEASASERRTDAEGALRFCETLTVRPREGETGLSGPVPLDSRVASDLTRPRDVVLRASVERVRVSVSLDR